MKILLLLLIVLATIGARAAPDRLPHAEQAPPRFAITILRLLDDGPGLGWPASERFISPLS